MSGILDGKVALITGAGSGIGRAASRVFAREGAKLVLADWIGKGGEETLHIVQDLGAPALFIKTDVSKWSEAEAMIAKAVAAYGQLDCAFNNAGIEGAQAVTHQCTMENWEKVIAVDLTGTWLCMKAELAQMLKQGGGGAIVNSSSTAGLAGVHGMPAYVVAKHGIAGLTKAAAVEYGRHKIRVNAVCAGPIQTPMFERLVGERPDPDQRVARGGPLKRLGEAEEIAEVAAWLCSDRASYVTGVPIPVDGGFMAQWP
jgi:NAD(P)-dependent dehydrogenase (short-subunit alcohol dehydrogenase family)